MKILQGLLVTSLAALEFDTWNQPEENAFSWIEPKSRLRRDGDADDLNVLKFVERSKKPSPTLQNKVKQSQNQSRLQTKKM